MNRIGERSLHPILSILPILFHSPFAFSPFRAFASRDPRDYRIFQSWIVWSMLPVAIRLPSGEKPAEVPPAPGPVGSVPRFVRPPNVPGLPGVVLGC